MKFTNLHIHAFGRLAGESLELSDGLNVILGSNEAGKTTLKNFIETMLYGFKPANDSNPYWPWVSGSQAFGGELAYVLESGGRFRVRRHLELRGRKAHETCDVREGLEGDGPRASFDVAELATEHVGHRREIWRNVFAIDLAALVDMSALDRADRTGLEQVFFRDLCALGTIANPKTVLSDLADELAQLKLVAGSGRRKKGEIDLFVGSELASARSAVREARDRQRRIRELRGDVADLETQRRAILKARAEINAQIEVLTQRMPLVELYREWREAQQTLQAAGDHTFDERTASALTVDAARLAETRTRIEREEAGLRESKQRLDAVTASAADDDAFLEHDDEIDALARQAEAMSAALRAWREADRVLAEQERMIRKSLSVVCRSSEADHEALLELTPEAADAMLQQVEKWRTLENRIVDLEQIRRTLVEQLREASDSVDTLKNRLPDDVPADYKPSQLREADDVLRSLDQLDVASRRVSELEERLRDEEGRLRLIRRQVADSSGLTRAAAPTGWIVAGVMALVLGFTAAAFYFSQGQSATAIWPTALGLAGGGVLAYAFTRRRNALLDEGLVQHSDLLQGQLVRIERLKQNYEDASAEFEDAQKTAEAGWRGMDLSGEPNRMMLTKRVAELRAFDDARQDLPAYEAATRELARLRARADAEEQRHETLRRERHELITRLGKQAESLGLLWDEEFSADRARQIVATAGRLVTEWRSLVTERRRLDAQRAEHESFSSKCRSLAGALGDTGEADVEQCVQFWKRTLDAARERLAERKRLDQDVDGRQACVSQLRAAADALERGIADACKLLGIERAEDVDATRNRAKRIDALKERVTTLSEAFDRQRLNAGLPDSWRPGESADGANAEPSTEPATQDGISHAELVARREEIDAEIETLNRRTAEIRSIIDEMSTGQSIAMAEGALEAARDKYAAMCARYDALLVAHRLLDAALRDFQRERQPQIVARAQRYLERLTAGSRTRLEADLFADTTSGRADAKTPPLHLVSDAGQAHPIDRFSRGTREQAYLALRLALAAELSADERLPLVLDDVLVNFDDDRAAAAARLVADIAGERQVIFLTCHQHARELLKKHDANVLMLSHRGERSGSKPRAARATS